MSTIGLIAASGLLISRAALRPAILDLMVLIGVVRLLAIGRGSLRYLERLASHDAALRSLGGMRVWFYERLEPLAPGGLGAERSGDLLGRFAGDVDSLQSVVVRGVVPLTVAAVTTAAAIVAASTQFRRRLSCAVCARAALSTSSATSCLIKAGAVAT